ncbi:apoptosis facilitator Bcl-2-like protein 14 [Clinocottus analis]|uniref:apoptosis facilitator Bcl-2-like protein 14 n=1 Tax=Clinocottus analis TaxID=304258 RepID=UPI0035C1CC7D
MANGHVQIHDPLSTPNGGTDPKPPSDPDSMEDSVEFRLLMAFAKRRLPQREGPAATAGGDADDAESESSPLQTPDKTDMEEEEEKKTRRKKKKKRLSLNRLRRNIFSCIKPQTEDGKTPTTVEASPDADDRCGPMSAAFFREAAEEEKEEEEELKETANRLTKIADEIPFTPPDVEADSPDDENGDENVEKMIGLLLRAAGDQLNEAELKDAAIASELFWNYGFFRVLMTTLLTRMGLQSRRPESPGPKASPKTQIAVACEVTTRLAAVASLPRNRLLDHGARYLQHYYSSWAQQQGGYEEAFYSDGEDEEEQ